MLGARMPKVGSGPVCRGRRRLRALIVVAAVVSACDTMIADRFVIAPPHVADAAAQSTVALRQTVRDILIAHGLSRVDGYSDEHWAWRDPQKLPGVRVSMSQDGPALHLYLSQDLFGPVGPTEKYRQLRSALLDLERFSGPPTLRLEEQR